jgi:hypothetical protein
LQPLQRKHECAVVVRQAVGGEGDDRLLAARKQRRRRDLNEVACLQDGLCEGRTAARLKQAICLASRCAPNTGTSAALPVPLPPTVANCT